MTAQCAEMLLSYGVREIAGDSYAGRWPISGFARHGINYLPSGMTTSEHYMQCVPLFTSTRVALVDQPRLIDQLCSLRRKIGPAGREAVDHPRGAHDDIAAAVCGLLYRLSPATAGGLSTIPWIGTPSTLAAELSLNPASMWAKERGYVDPERAFAGWKRFDNVGSW